jgi:transposase
MRAYSPDLRERIILGRKSGQSAAELAKQFKVCKRSVERFWERYQKNGELSARKRGGRRPAKLLGQDKHLRQWTEKNNGITLAELAVKCREHLGIKVVLTTISNRLKRLGLSHKKKSTGSRAKPARR